MLRLLSARGAVLVVLAFAILTPAARGSFHLWKITEFYSNSSGTIQFVEMFDPSSGENFLVENGATLRSNSQTYNFPTDPAGDTTDKNLLIATPGYAALGSAVPTANYVLPINNFWSTSADTVNFSFLDTLAYTAGQLPIDGNLSLNRAYAAGGLGTTAANSPTNFAGITGHVPEPTAATILLAATPVILRRRGAR